MKRPRDPSAEPPSRPLRYALSARLGDWYHGWRDGWTGIPDRHTATRYVTTPHREMLIRLGQETFEQERLRYERSRGDAPERIAGTLARLDQLRAHRAEAERQLAEIAQPLSAQAETWRRIGDVDRPERVVIQRRRAEQRRQISAVRLTLNSVIAEIGRVEAQLAEAQRTDQRELQVASTRVLRFHEYIHRRIDCYLRSLIRWHPDGAWAGAHLVVPRFLPGWLGPEPPPESGLRDHVTPPRESDDDADEAEPKPARVIPLSHPVTAFGSAQPEPYRIEAPGTARLHFTLALAGPGQLRLRDFGHGHGPYRNGQPVTSELLAAGDHFDFAGGRYHVRDGCDELEEVPLGKVNLIVSELWAKSPQPGWFSRREEPKVRLTSMSFVQRAGTVLAVLGPSGAGKSSLLDALIGDLATESGRMFLGDLDISTRSEQISDELGFVPQDIDLHTALTVRQLLRYSFDLRYSGSRHSRDMRIEQVCGDLELSGQIDQLVSTLSGGQKRRVSIAIELLGKPSLLILDEPTSGLDPGMDRSIMRQLRHYAGEGNTVMVTTHATAHLRDAEDKSTTVTEVLVVADHGQPIFLGRPNRARQRLGARTYADLMDKLIPKPGGQTNDWTAASATEYRNGREAAEARTAAEEHIPVAVPRSSRRKSVLILARQLWTLLKRQATLLKVRGRRKNARLIPWPVVVALLPFIVVGIAALLAAQITPATGLGAKPGTSGSIALSVLTTLAMLSGQALTYGDLVSDFPIIRRERRTGALLATVMLSKWLVYSGVAVLQAVLAMFAFEALRPGPAYANLLPPFAELAADLAALSIASLSLGLLISALASKLEQAVALVTLTSITQIALNGVTAQLSRGLNVVAVLLPDRWGLAAASSSVNLDRILVPPHEPADALWRHSTGQWATDLIALTAQAIGYAVLATLLLSRRLRARPTRRRSRTSLRRRTSRTT